MQTGLYFSIQIGELNQHKLDVVSFRLEEALSSLFTLSVQISTTDANINLQEQLLQKASFTVYVDGKKQRTINGIVEKAECGDIGFKRSFYTFIIRPAMWLLTLVQDSRIYHFKSVPDIIDEILKDFNIPFDKQLMDRHSVREYVTQKRESYYQFVSRLASEEGIIFWFEEDKLFYSDSHLGMRAGPKIIYNPHPQNSTKDWVINQLKFACTMRSTEIKTKEYLYTHPDVPMDARSITSKQLPVYETYDSYGRYDNSDIGQLFSSYRIDALQSDSEQGQAFSNCFPLMPGVIFSLLEHPTQSMNNSWQVVHIVHKGTLPQSLEDESDNNAATLTNEFSFVPGKNDWRPKFTHKPLADGDEVATVVGPAGEEIYVNEDGAVKVAFHWNRYDQLNENASCWVRVAQNWNGDGYGFLATPRIGQEVIISYLNGDIDRPIITGTTYNGKNRPPIDLPRHKTQMTIKSKTHKGEGFNEMRFEDEKGLEEIYFHAQRNHRTNVLNDQFIDIDHNRTKNIGLDQQETVGRDKRTNVGQDHYETIGRNSIIRVMSDQEIEIENNQTTIINSSRKQEIYADNITKTGGNQRLEIEGTYDEIAKTKIFSRTKHYILHAQDKMTIAGPGGSITIDNNGITLKATALKIITPSFDIINGGSNQVTALKAAVQEGKPFCEICAKAKKDDKS
ncbi:type VI secretion system secreted protein VgrG [Frischella perrara]|jgi:Rhs element Vgr protein|uniref:Rhs element Vgr protein n=1 Tax=Frischella perrara TaxID=1267021 RepID=A0A0A7S253_FRIPE|nr:type VI secretion system tip protein TssI/VgrG [Frischella perrara]AJA45599.1 Rhs element Vgr protein [Frischella perrara]PWV58948.1 type VI secretion system secreted protein VgrG [Frischella perrara]